MAFQAFGAFYSVHDPRFQTRSLTPTPAGNIYMASLAFSQPDVIKGKWGGADVYFGPTWSRVDGNDGAGFAVPGNKHTGLGGVFGVRFRIGPK
jgi:hypothetical protein